MSNNSTEVLQSSSFLSWCPSLMQVDFLLEQMLIFFTCLKRLFKNSLFIYLNKISNSSTEIMFFIFSWCQLLMSQGQTKSRWNWSTPVLSIYRPMKIKSGKLSICIKGNFAFHHFHHTLLGLFKSFILSRAQTHHHFSCKSHLNFKLLKIQ